MSEPQIHARERRLRRAAHSRGYRLVKSRRRAVGDAGYLVIDAERDMVVIGAEPAFSATLEQVESFLMDGSTPRLRRRVWPPGEIAEDQPLDEIDGEREPGR